MIQRNRQLIRQGRRPNPNQPRNLPGYPPADQAHGDQTARPVANRSLTNQPKKPPRLHSSPTIRTNRPLPLRNTLQSHRPPFGIVTIRPERPPRPASATDTTRPKQSSAGTAATPPNRPPVGRRPDGRIWPIMPGQKRAISVPKNAPISPGGQPEEIFLPNSL